MGYESVLNSASLVAGAASAICWIVAAVVKVKPPAEMKDKPDGMYYGYIIASGGDLISTVKAQAKWNSAAAITAAVAVLLQTAANLISS